MAENLPELHEQEDQWPCQACAKRGLPACWVDRDASGRASTGRGAVVGDERLPVLYLSSQPQDLPERGSR